jgi:hypothetical protein
MAIVGILSSCRSTGDQERFAKRHHQAFGAALDIGLPRHPAIQPSSTCSSEW